MQENQKKIDEFDRKHPPVNKSLSEAVIGKEAEGLKAACKAALKTKPGGASP